MSVDDEIGVSRDAADALVGRDGELARLRALLEDPAVRLVTLTGPHGVGKSRVARAALPGAGPRVVVVDLDAVTDAGIAADQVVAALGVDGSLATLPGHALWEAEQGRPALVLLDETDGVERLEDLVLPMLETYPAVTVVATRAQPLRTPGEVTVAVGPLGDLDSADPRDNAALALFVTRAREVDASFAVDEDTLARAAALCRALGGLPFAIELAAARMGTIPLAVVLDQLESAAGLSLLRRNDDTELPDRRRSVDAALDWSWSRLSPQAAELVAQLAVFAGPFDLDAAVAVVTPSVPAPELLDRLSELVDAHLLDLDLSDPETERFRLEPLARHRAALELRRAESGATVRDRHAAYWVRRVRLDPSVVRRHPTDVLAALDRSISEGRFDEALHLVLIAGPELMNAPGAEASLVPLVEGALDSGSVDDDELAARTLMWATAHAPATGTTPQEFGQWTAARVRRSIALARSSGDADALLVALEMAVSTLGVTFDLPLALASVQEGHALAMQVGDEAALARFEVWSAMAASLHGDLATFSRTARQAYERGLRMGDQVAVCHAGTMLHRLPAGDQGPTPLLSLDELLERAEAGRRPTLVMEVLSTQTQLALLHGDVDGVLAPLSRMLLIADDIERLQPMAPVPCLMQAVIVASAVGRDEDAARLRAYLAPIEQLLPAIIPSLAGAYAAVVAGLRDKVGEPRYDELTAEGVGASLAMGNRAAQVFVRGLRPEVTAASTEAQAAGLAGDAAPTDRASTAATHPALTPRELDVLERLVSGGTNREIAEDLGLSTKTVMHHTMAIYRKLGVRGRAEAVSWALRSGTVPVR